MPARGCDEGQGRLSVGLRLRLDGGEEWFFVAGTGVEDDLATVTLAREWEGRSADPTAGTPFARGVQQVPPQRRVKGPW